MEGTKSEGEKRVRKGVQQSVFVFVLESKSNTAGRTVVKPG